MDDRVDVRSLGALVERHGGSVSTAVLDPANDLLEVPGVPGVLPYRRGLGNCAVAIGEPVCAPEHAVRLLDAFHDRFRSTIFAITGPRFAAHAEERGYASVEFGEELVFDPRRELPHGRRGHEVRKKLNLARRQGVRVREYRPEPRVAAVERTMEALTSRWLAARRGPQVYLSRIALFDDRERRRWFLAEHEDHLAGVLALMHLGMRDGYLLEHLLVPPDSPSGTSEALIAAALETLGHEGCAFATMGPAPGMALGRIHGLTSFSERVARTAFRAGQAAFHLDALARFRRKFGGEQAEPRFILAHPPRFGPLEVLSLLRAFNVSPWPRRPPPARPRVPGRLEPATAP